MTLICPVCGALVAEGLPCAKCEFVICRKDGIIRALTPERRAFYERFLRDYSTIRASEGRGSNDRQYYLALPYRDLSGKNSEQWRIRGCSYRYFESNILKGKGLDILDLGAGNGWMSYRLSKRGDRPVAVDIFTDPLDGLAAAREYGMFPVIEAEFDRLPFPEGQFDMAVFNSSFHYSTDYHATLSEVRRRLRPGGRIVILDTPLYKQREHGEQMTAERHAYFTKRYGFPSDSLASLEFIYEKQLAELARDLGLRWRIHEPWYGWRWHLRPLKALLQRRRPPSQFCILEASFPNP